jgi:hypothetical protein
MHNTLHDILRVSVAFFGLAEPAAPVASAAVDDGTAAEDAVADTASSAAGLTGPAHCSR